MILLVLWLVNRIRMVGGRASEQRLHGRGPSMCVLDLNEARHRELPGESLQFEGQGSRSCQPFGKGGKGRCPGVLASPSTLGGWPLAGTGGHVLRETTWLLAALLSLPR